MDISCQISVFPADNVPTSAGKKTAWRWVTKGYSTLIMNMMRKANQDLLIQAGPVLRDIKEVC